MCAVSSNTSKIYIFWQPFFFIINDFRDQRWTYSLNQALFLQFVYIVWNKQLSYFSDDVSQLYLMSYYQHEAH